MSQSLCEIRRVLRRRRHSRKGSTVALVRGNGHGFGTKALFALIRAISRMADAFGFFVPGPKAFEAGAKYLLARGYR